jgi:hypothetical protein
MSYGALLMKAHLIGIGHLSLVWILGALGGLIAMAFVGLRDSSTGGASG